MTCANYAAFLAEFLENENDLKICPYKEKFDLLHCICRKYELLSMNMNLFDDDDNEFLESQKQMGLMLKQKASVWHNDVMKTLESDDKYKSNNYLIMRLAIHKDVNDYIDEFVSKYNNWLDYIETDDEIVCSNECNKKMDTEEKTRSVGRGGGGGGDGYLEPEPIMWWERACMMCCMVSIVYVAYVIFTCLSY